MTSDQLMQDAKKYGNAYTSHLSSNYAPLLDGIYTVENRGIVGDPTKAISPKGAAGTYQVMPGTYKLIQKALPNKWRNIPFVSIIRSPLLSREVSGDLMDLNRQSQIDNGIVPTEETLVANHNLSLKGIIAHEKNGTPYPKETQDYLGYYAKFKKLRKGKSNGR